MAPQTVEEEKYDLVKLKALLVDDVDMPDLEGVYCIKAGDDWEREQVLGRFSCEAALSTLA